MEINRSFISLPAYPGKGLPRIEYERHIIRADVDPDLLAEEPRLYQTKWWDYRRLHHGEATMMFAFMFRRALQEAWAKYFDAREAEDRAGFQGDNIFAIPRLSEFPSKKDKSELSARKAALTGMWKARQTADAFGVPYGLFLKYTLDEILQWKVWRNTPQATHLYQPDATINVLERWSALRHSMLIRPESSYFTAAEYRGDALQDEFYKWLCQLVAGRSAPEHVLADLVFAKQVIPEKIAVREFSPEILGYARDISRL